MIFIIILWWICQILGNYFLFKTTLTNPGIVPKLEVDPSLMVKITSAKVNYSSHSYRTVYLNSSINMSFCKEWIIVRPPRCYHCYYWDNWVENFDHHCTWISCCVGKRNYNYFVSFISFISLFLLTQIAGWVWGLCVNISRHEIIESAVLGFIILYCVGFLCFTGYLSLYHLYIIWIGQTTKENLRKIFIRFH